MAEPKNVAFMRIIEYLPCFDFCINQQKDKQLLSQLCLKKKQKNGIFYSSQIKGKLLRIGKVSGSCDVERMSEKQTIMGERERGETALSSVAERMLERRSSANFTPHSPKKMEDPSSVLRREDGDVSFTYDCVISTRVWGRVEPNSFPVLLVKLKFKQRDNSGISP